MRRTAVAAAVMRVHAARPQLAAPQTPAALRLFGGSGWIESAQKLSVLGY